MTRGWTVADLRACRTTVSARGFGWCLRRLRVRKLRPDATRTWSPSRVGAAMKANLIYAQELGLVNFTVPHCADYIRRNLPFASVEWRPSSDLVLAS